MPVACPDKLFVRRSRLIPSSWQVRGFCYSPEGALDPEGLLRALVLWEGGWGCPPPVGGVEHTMAEWANLGTLELLLPLLP